MASERGLSASFDFCVYKNYRYLGVSVFIVWYLERLSLIRYADSAQKKPYTTQFFFIFRLFFIPQFINLEIISRIWFVFDLCALWRSDSIHTLTNFKYFYL